MSFPVDKLTVINQALALVGDNLCATADDGSDEWLVASAAYETAIEYLFEAHNWNFATAVTTLPRAGTPGDPLYADAYLKPSDCIHLIWVRTNDVPAAYAVLGNQIVLTAGGGAVTIKYVSSSNADQHATRIFFTALQHMVMSGIYRGGHEDQSAADRMWSIGMAALDQAKTRSDQEQPKRALFSFRLRASRSVRRPYPRSPRDFGGTGVPG